MMVFYDKYPLAIKNIFLICHGIDMKKNGIKIKKHPTSLSRDDLRFKVFLGSVALHSALGTCDRLRTACGIINNKRLRGIGYNGSVSGLAHCDQDGHLMVDNHCIRTRHGEVNAITNTDRKDIRDGQAIVIATPCLDCAKDLAEEGIRRIDYVGSYENSLGKQHLAELAKQTRGCNYNCLAIADVFSISIGNSIYFAMAR